MGNAKSVAKLDTDGQAQTLHVLDLRLEIPDLPMPVLRHQTVALRGNMTTRMISVTCLVLAMSHSGIAAAQDQVDTAALAEMQKRFVAAYNHGDVDVMAEAFTENAIRVTPSGIFQGRDAIRRSFQDALKLGLHDYSVNRTISRSEGPYTFNIGSWQGKLGDRPFRGYYTAIVVRDGGQAKILQETVTVAAPCPS